MIILGKYTFLPFLKKGLGNFTGISDQYDGTSIDGNGPVKERPDISVSLRLDRKDGSKIEDFSKDFQTYGPGDIIGFNKKNIVKAYPHAGNFDFLPNYLPYIEFYDEDLPWRYTPASTGSGATTDRLTPWFTLLVLKDDDTEFTITKPSPDGFEQLNLLLPNLLPPSDELGVFAHVHINKGLDESNLASDLRNEMNANPDNVISRLIGNRKLEQFTSYQAFLIPTFETGRLVGLNPLANVSIVDAMQLAWDQQTNPTQFPIYYSWKFGTTEKDDFETLAKRLNPGPLPNTIGKREFDIQGEDSINFSLNFNNTGSQVSFSSKKLSIGGALRVDGVSFDVLDAAEQSNFAKFMANYLNLESLYDSGVANNTVINKNISPNGDPVITAPLYARWHAAINEIDASAGSTTLQWIKDLNLVPRNRASAGLGTDTIINKQEEFMDDAWGQVGEVLEANKLIHQAQAALEASCKIHEQFAKMPKHRQIITTGPMHKKARSN